MQKKILLWLVIFICVVSVRGLAAERVPLRVAQFPLTVQSYRTPPQDVQDQLERLVDRSLHIPLNATLQAVAYIPEKECLAALETVQNGVSGKVKMKALMRPLAEQLRADLIVMPVLTGYEQYQTMSWHRWGRYITRSYAAVEIVGYDKSKDEVFCKGASRHFNDEYSTQGDVRNMAYEVMDEALRRAKVHERIWIWNK
ncbi:MAG: hypothetical protein K6F95_10620 [Selenomonas sp.]|uniref:hypothetical protein n=1 Tax=Selenomonas sp. TaxID=2053611 RepID=UPI0025E67E88|nr:hypothetical protein [Selenomonas sp.]MCR5758344.1 hypothetical protein [Selenomonas sp.]